jgi:hypothetical protein
VGVNEAKSVSLSDFGNTTLGCFEAPKDIETVSLSCVVRCAS